MPPQWQKQKWRKFVISVLGSGHWAVDLTGPLAKLIALLAWLIGVHMLMSLLIQLYNWTSTHTHTLTGLLAHWLLAHYGTIEQGKRLIGNNYEQTAFVIPQAAFLCGVLLTFHWATWTGSWCMLLAKIDALERHSIFHFDQHARRHFSLMGISRNNKLLQWNRLELVIELANVCFKHSNAGNFRFHLA